MLQSSRHVTATWSVRNLCVMVASSHDILVPEPNISAPACAIITPLSIQKRSSVANNLPLRSAHMMPIISCNRSLHPTPPTMSTWNRIQSTQIRYAKQLQSTSENTPIQTSFDPQCAIARSVISTSIAKMVSCSEKHKSASEYSSGVPLAFAFCRDVFTWFSMCDNSPEKLTSIPFTQYGNDRNFLPCFANCSIL